jgi:hypothetical protein
MTHTFKLARRMARFRILAAVSALLAAAGCGGGDDLGFTTPGAPPAAQNDPSKLDSLISSAPPETFPPVPSPTGIPFGPFNAWDGTDLNAGTEVFTASLGSVNTSNILRRVAKARASGVKLILAMTGGGHHRYLTKGVFNLAKWKARMNAYNTPEIQAAVATAVADGTIIGNVVMDEPHVSGLGDGNTWGPRGTMTKARVDGMCQYVRSIFPTLPVGVVHQPNAFEPQESYRVCDFLVAQYAWRSTAGNILKFRDEALALGRRDGMAIVFSMNILNGGVQALRDGTWKCSRTTTGGRGTFDPNCRMTPQQIRDWGIALGSAGCALVMWRYDPAFMSKPVNVEAFRAVGAALASVQGRGCRRS